VARTSPRRVSVPAADALFRPADPTPEELAAEAHTAHVRAVPDSAVDAVDAADRADGAGGAHRADGADGADGVSRRRPSGRVRHDEKMTVYVTSEELVDLEHARLALRRDHGLAVDRGRLVREALSLVLADLEHNGLDSMLVQRLTER
jgi:hypothetical protein